jgi:hypothetical protein
MNRVTFSPCGPSTKQSSSRRLELKLLEGRNLLSAPAVIDVVGHLPATEYNQFIAGALNFQGNPFKDWGNEPSLAINPLEMAEVHP